MISFGQVVSSSKGNEVCIVSGRCYGHASSTSYICMTELIGESLQFVGCKSVVIPNDMIVARTTGALNTCMAAQIEIELGRMSDVVVDCRARWNISTLAALFLAIHTEKSRMMSLLNDHVSNAWLIFFFQFHTRFPNRIKLIKLKLKTEKKYHKHLVNKVNGTF